MRKLSITLATAALGITAPALADYKEINYPKGSLGYADLMAGDNEAAIRSIRADTNVRHDDPARLLNLGLAHERSGDWQAAQEHYAQVLKGTRATRLVLSNGDVRQSHDLAKQGLRRVESQLARR